MCTQCFPDEILFDIASAKHSLGKKLLGLLDKITDGKLPVVEEMLVEELSHAIMEELSTYVRTPEIEVSGIDDDGQIHIEVWS